ncbi:hypothetical protein, partial [Pseudomonas viridiflava]|uniref:hypothetical protein n=1 Tax=Pseudomonas viridiflava TaxID=33069 RepID=UPI001F121442
FYALIDTATMTIVGIHLTIQAASQVGLMQSLQFAFSPKESHLKRNGAVCMSGPPRRYPHIGSG